MSNTQGNVYIVLTALEKEVKDNEHVDASADNNDRAFVQVKIVTKSYQVYHVNISPQSSKSKHHLNTTFTPRQCNVIQS